MATSTGTGAGRSATFAAAQPRRLPFAFLAAVRASGLPGAVGAERAATAVFCALQVRLPSAVLARFEAALPEELRDLVGRCAPEHAGPPEGFGREEYLRRVADHLDVRPGEAEEVTRSVFAGIRRLLASPEQPTAIARLLPADLAALWDDEDGPGDAEPAPLHPW